MDRRASTAETVCETGLRRIADATERAGLSDVAEEASRLRACGLGCAAARRRHFQDCPSSDILGFAASPPPACARVGWFVQFWKCFHF